MKNHRNRFLLCILILIILSVSSACTKKNETDCTFEIVNKIEDSEVITEAEASFRYLWEQAQTKEDSRGYGLVRDRYPGNPDLASTAATGFALAAIPYAVEKEWITREEGEQRVLKTLDTILSLENEKGFLYHFINLNSGIHAPGSEISSIDTAILLCGAITAGQYFGGEIQEKTDCFYDGIDWNSFLDPKNNQFYMSYQPDQGYSGHWDVYAEQLMLYVLAAGSDTYPTGKVPYQSFRRLKGSYQDYEFIHSWFGSIFTYQFSHAFIDFQKINDEDGINWYNNSVAASLAARQYCIDHKDEYLTYSENSWGLTACDDIDGYNGLLGAPPSGTDDRAHVSNGTIAPAGAIGSIVFTPEYSIDALINYYSYNELLGEYGLRDSYNLDADWYAGDYIGIDKGISCVMIANYESNYIWQLFMQNENIQNALSVLGFSDSRE